MLHTICSIVQVNKKQTIKIEKENEKQNGRRIVMASSEKLVIGPRVPRGLAPAVEGLAREVLRHRPQDIYTFAARHFEQLIELRETGRASNRKCRRVLVDWIGPDNKCQPVSDGGSNHDRYRFSVRKVHDSIEETRQAIKETTGTLSTISTKLLTKRRRRRAAGGEVVAAAANRNGWSINETAKVFKKHAYENNANKEKSRNAQKSKKSIEKEIHGYFEKRSPRLSKTIAHCRFHRSWSVEDMHLAKNSSRRFQENQVEPPKRNRGSIELNATNRPENDTRTCDKSNRSVENTENTTVRCLKRQKSAGQVEDVCSSSLYAPWRMNRGSVEYNIAAPRRTHSLVNVTSNGSYERTSSGKEETENISNEVLQSGVQGRRESFRGKGIGGKERRKSEEGTTSDTGVDDTREIVVGKLNARLESDGTGSKDNGRVGETFEYQFWSNSKGIVDDTNVIIDEPRFLLREDRTDRTSKQEYSLDDQGSVVLPSVIKKQGSNSRHSENLSERSKNDTNYLILPPISADASKPVKREDNLVLPVLSKLSEVIEIDRQPLQSFGEERVASIEDGTEHMELDASVSESQTLQQVSDCDYRSTEAVHRTARSCETTANAARYETAQGTCRSMVVDRAIEDDEGSEVRVEMYALGENRSNVTSDFVQVPQTSPRNQKEKNEKQENEKEEEVENGNSTTMIGDEQQEREEQLNMGEQKTYPIGNDELKSKLIEIETVERNIENTLTSSETVLIAEDDREPMASRPMDCSTNSESESESEKSSILFGNNLEATSIAGEMLQEKDMLCDTKEDSSCNCSSKNDQTDTVPRKESNASTTVASSSVEDDDAIMGVEVVDDSDESEPARHGSAGRHEVSINFSKDVDPSCYVLTEGSPCEIPESVTTVIIPDKSLGLQQSDDEIFRFDRETIDDTPRTGETIEQDTNPFGEYIVHSAETFQYSTDNRHADFLHDIEDTVDRTLAYKDLSNIKEEEREEEEEEEEDKKLEEEEDKKEEEEDKKEEKYKSKGDAMRAEKVVETRCTIDEATSDQLERNDTARVENVPSDTTVCTNQGQGGTTLEDSKREQPLSSVSDTVTEPCVPELDLDSFRDATLSSVEDGNDSINVENLSAKKNVDGNVICEPDTTSASFDTVSPKREATINKNPLSDDRPNPDRFQDESATSSHDCSIDRRDSSTMEEEIARELIEHLTGETSTLEETTDKNTAEATDSFGRNDNIPSEHATVSTVTVEPIDIDMDMNTDMVMDVDIDGNTQDGSDVKGEGDSVASTCSRSVDTFKNRNLYELSKESVIDSNLRIKSLEAAVGIIQFQKVTTRSG
ncbi:uncharacterized protein LOC143210679 isoform X2 [Lasioglossum baleicum]|uniref:uncharacterized protein LOC143210679 isoform X2 n=1 Tax=Lasioglossum baleicum TaxID=434251 RepID=UPI003FCE7386